MAERNLGYVNLRQIRKNARTLKAQAKTKLLAVVKANAYGHGAEMVATALHNVVDGFCVALAEEGISLRYAGVSLPILVFSPPQSVEEAFSCIRHDLTMTVDGVLSLKRVIFATEQIQKQALVHLKIETGMHRLGMDGEELRNVMQLLNQHPAISLLGMYTHFACVKDEKFTLGQYERFLHLVTPYKKARPNLILHAGATGAIAYGNRFALDAVRTGIGLYGYGIQGVSPVLTLFAPVIKRGKVEKGERLGYGNPVAYEYGYALTRFGYADGGLRNAGGITPRCMDLSFLPDQARDSVEILGENNNAERLAKQEGTIPYEILTRYTARASLLYLN